MMRATAKAPLTGIKGLLRSSIGERLRMPPNREKISVAVRIRADRILPGEAAIVEALTAAARSGVVARAPLEVEVSEAVKRGNRAAVAVRAVRACLQEVEVEVVAVAAVAVVAAVVVAAVAVEAAVVGAGRNRQAA
jgi:hypothetical protein